MGKMILDDLRKRLERLDEDADLTIDNDDRYQMVIVGGSAFILLGKLTRATHDIDALSVPKELYGLLGKYDINTDVEAYIDNFPYNYPDRLKPLPFGGTKVQFYTPSLEDLVIAKLSVTPTRQTWRVKRCGTRWTGTCWNISQRMRMN